MTISLLKSVLSGMVIYPLMFQKSFPLSSIPHGGKAVTGEVTLNVGNCGNFGVCVWQDRPGDKYVLYSKYLYNTRFVQLGNCRIEIEQISRLGFDR